MKNLVDLHTHSVLSKHAYSSVTENIDAAFQAGLKYYGISEHQNDDKGVGAHPYAFLNLHVIPSLYKGMRILKGVELNILPDGSIDTSKLRMSEFDYCIASVHTYMYPPSDDVEANTAAYLKALELPYVRILGHIDDARYPIDYEKVIMACKKLGKVIELNNASLNPGGSRKGAMENDLKILDLCIKHNQPIVVDSDAHICYDIGGCQTAFALLKDISFPEKLILNYNEELFIEMFDLPK